MKRSIFDAEIQDVSAKQALLRASSMMAPRFVPQRPQTAPTGAAVAAISSSAPAAAATDQNNQLSSRMYHTFEQQGEEASSQAFSGAVASSTNVGSTSLVGALASFDAHQQRLLGSSANLVGPASEGTPPASPVMPAHVPMNFTAYLGSPAGRPISSFGPSSAASRRLSSPGQKTPVIFLVSSAADDSGGVDSNKSGESSNNTKINKSSKNSGKSKNNNNNTNSKNTIFNPSADPLDEDPIFRLWMRRNPDADSIDIAAAKHRRMKELADAQRTERMHFLRQLQRDLGHLRAVDELGDRTGAALDRLITDGSPASLAAMLLKQAQAQAAAAQQQEQQQKLQVGRGGLSVAASNSAVPAAAQTPAKSPQRSVLDGMRQAEIEAQRLAWLTYTGQLEDNPGAQKPGTVVPGIGSNSLQSPPPPGPSAAAAAARKGRGGTKSSAQQQLQQQQQPQQVLDDLDQDGHAISSSPHTTASSTIGELARRGWIDGAGIWHASTDRHENAATCIQCAFRSFVARARAAQRRRLRTSATQRMMAAEAALERAWVAATSVKDAQMLSSEVDKTIRTMDMFSLRLKAVVARRRMRKQREGEVYGEVAQYAIVRMQAVVRGFLVRRRVELIRNPRLAAAKLALIQNVAATQIQRIVRGRLARALIRRRMLAATRIQAVYRRHLCLFRAGQTRRQRRVNADAELADYAARIIQRFMRSLVVRRRRGLRRFREQALLLQRTGRAYFARQKAAALFHGMVDEAAVDIQRMFRGWYARNHYVSGLVMAHKNAMEEALQQHAACIVTRAFRRARIFADKRNELLRSVAATEIQRIYRGYRARKAYREEQKREQNLLRAQMEQNAASIVQAAWRGFATRKRYNRRALSSSPKSSPTSTTAGKKAAAIKFNVADTETTRKAHAVLRRFYRNHIRQPKLAAFLRHKARHVCTFLRSVSARRTLHLFRDFRSANERDGVPAAKEAERRDAVRHIVDTLQSRVLARREFRSERALARRKAAVNRAEEAQGQEQSLAALQVQRCVRGYLIRRYLLLITGIERSRKQREAAMEELSKAPEKGVTSYDAACALQKFFVKHAEGKANYAEAVAAPSPPAQ